MSGLSDWLRRHAAPRRLSPVVEPAWFVVLLDFDDEDWEIGSASLESARRRAFGTRTIGNYPNAFVAGCVSKDDLRVISVWFA